jgi:uncharacterized protein (TIGR02569 family)
LTSPHREPPPASVVATFGCRGSAEPLAGGEGQSWRCDDAVLKPTSDPEQATWIAEVVESTAFADVVVARPIQSRAGAWVVQGWTAFEFVDARHEAGRWPEIIAAGRAFHAALASLRRPAWMDRADDWWRRADAVAWGTREAVGNDALVALVHRLGRLRRPVVSHDQVVHGDLCGNVLFDADARPVVIDFSPYWRPAEWASAVVAIDAFEWEGAGDGALHWLDELSDAQQLLVRAAMFRIATSAEVAAVNGLDERKRRVHTATVDALEQLARR